MITEGALRIGQSIAKQVAGVWFAEKKANSRRGRDLSKLIRARFPVRRQERDVLDSLLTIEDEVARSLESELERISYDLDDNEAAAALIAVSDTLEDIDLSDRALFAVDVNPGDLAAVIRAQRGGNQIGLSERGTRLYDAALSRACVALVHLVKELPEFDAAAAAETLVRLRTALKGIDQLLQRLPAQDLSAPTGRHFDEEFLHRYNDLLARRCDRLDVIGLTTHSYEPRTTLSVAYLSLTVTNDTEAARNQTEELDWRDIGQRPTDNLRVEVALADSRLTVVRGEAGGGKSTLLRWLALSAAQASFTGQLADWNECTPFLVKLRDFANTPLPRGDELLKQPSSPEFGPVPIGWAHRQFESGKALLLVDGVDELVARRRTAVREWIRTLLASYPGLRVVVTSRPTAVTSKWLIHDGFRSVVLEPMTPEAVQLFLQRWHSALLDFNADSALLPCPPDEIDEHRRVLLAQLQARPHLRALARNPLLCAMLCVLNLDRRSRLPRDRVALYSAALDMLLERRDADRSVASGADIQISAGEKIILLQALAWWLGENGRSEMSREQALSRMEDRLKGMPNVRENAETILENLIERSGVIRQPALGRVDFIHRTLQEFLAAREVIDRDSIDLLVRHATSDLWRETVIMACAQGSSNQRARLLNGILDTSRSAQSKSARQLKLLAAACKETAVLAPPDVLNRVDSAIRSLVPPRSVRESRSLATVGESLLDHLPAELSGLTDAQAAACVRAAALINGPRALDLLSRYSFDERPEATHQLIRSWKYFDPEIYVRKVLSNSSLTLRGPWDHVSVDRRSVPFLHLLKGLRRCHVNMWREGEISKEVETLGRLEDLTYLAILGDLVPSSITRLKNLENLDTLFVNMTDGWPSSVDFVGELEKLTDLGLVTFGQVRQFDFLNRLPNLRKLSLFKNPIASWMDEVVHPELLNTIVCSGMDTPEVQEKFASIFTCVTNLTIFGQTDLAAPVRDLQRLSSLPIQHLQFNDYFEPDLSSLSDYQRLVSIRFAGTGTVDLSPLRNSTIKVFIHPGMQVRGRENLGPGVRVKSW